MQESPGVHQRKLPARVAKGVSPFAMRRMRTKRSSAK